MNYLKIKGGISLKGKNIAYIACRIIAIYIIIQAIKYMSYFISMLFFMNQEMQKIDLIHMILTSIFPSIILLIVGVVLWALAIKISNHMIIENKNTEENEKNMEVNELQTVAFSVVGLVILVNIIPDLSKFISQIIHMRGNYIPTRSTTRLEIKISAIEIAVRFIIGIILFLKSKGIVGMINSLRKAGLKSTDKDE